MAGSNRGRDVPARTCQDRWPQPRPALPAPQACPGVPPGVAVYALCRDPETHALFLVPAPRVLSWPDIDGRRRGALLPGLRWDQSRRRTQLARGAEPSHPEPGRDRPQRDRPWRTSPAAHQRQEVRTWRPDLAQAGPEGAEWGPWSIFVAWTIFAIILWIVVTALAYYTYTAKSPGWGAIPRRAGQDGPSGAVQIMTDSHLLPAMSTDAVGYGLFDPVSAGQPQIPTKAIPGRQTREWPQITGVSPFGAMQGHKLAAADGVVSIGSTGDACCSSARGPKIKVATLTARVAAPSCFRRGDSRITGNLGWVAIDRRWERRPSGIPVVHGSTIPVGEDSSQESRACSSSGLSWCATPRPGRHPRSGFLA
jgi:hypothetical protein